MKQLKSILTVVIAATVSAVVFLLSTLLFSLICGLEYVLREAKKWVDERSQRKQPTALHEPRSLDREAQ
jgi:hypothetical protein